jgi:hypothetical protein
MLPRDNSSSSSSEERDRRRAFPNNVRDTLEVEEGMPFPNKILVHVYLLQEDIKNGRKELKKINYKPKNQKISILKLYLRINLPVFT